jgi:hypothetical protein
MMDIEKTTSKRAEEECKEEEGGSQEGMIITDMEQEICILLTTGTH